MSRGVAAAASEEFEMNDAMAIGAEGCASNRHDGGTVQTSESAAVAASGYDVVRCLLGLVLVAASVAKAYAFVTAPTNDGDFLNSRWFLTVLVAFEFSFGLCLLSGRYPRWSHRIAIGCFTVFFVFTALRALAGASTCGGCAGRIPVNPWYAGAFDLAAIVALLVWRPRRDNEQSLLGLRVFLPYVVGAGIFMGGLSAWAYSEFGSISAALARLRGDWIAMVPASLDLGEAQRGEFQMINVHVVNLSDRSIAIVGARSTCGCVPTYDLPLTLPANSDSTIRISVAFMGAERVFARQVVFYTDDKDQPNVVFWLTGRIIDSE